MGLNWTHLSKRMALHETCLEGGREARNSNRSARYCSFSLSVSAERAPHHLLDLHVSMVSLEKALQQSQRWLLEASRHDGCQN